MTDDRPKTELSRTELPRLWAMVAGLGNQPHIDAIVSALSAVEPSTLLLWDIVGADHEYLSCYENEVVVVPGIDTNSYEIVLVLANSNDSATNDLTALIRKSGDQALDLINARIAHVPYISATSTTVLQDHQRACIRFRLLGVDKDPETSAQRLTESLSGALTAIGQMP